MKRRCKRPRPLARRIFLWFGFSILWSILLVMIVMGALDFVWPSEWSNDVESVRHYITRTFEERWDDPAARDEAARTIAEDFNVNVRLEDPDGNILTEIGGSCRHGHAYRLPLGDKDTPFGFIAVCAPNRHRPTGLLKVFIALLVLGFGMWWTSLMIARRITRPLADVAAVADGIGRGDLRRRVGLGAHRTVEVGVLATAIDEMAERIQRQLDDQRELLAAVSHELRTPLGHLRVLIELAQTRKSDAEKLSKALGEMESEIVEVDRLVGELLASSKLDFGVEHQRTLDAHDVAAHALQRASLDASLLEAESGIALVGDAALINRALANLLDNAVRHGGGVQRLTVQQTADRVRFMVDDDGPGVEAADQTRIFQPLQRGKNGGVGSLGLGLALVARIAEAHGGRVYVENREAGGARFVFETPSSPAG